MVDERMIVKVQISFTEPVRMLVYNRDRSYLAEEPAIPELHDAKGYKGFMYARLVEHADGSRELEHLGEAPWQDW